MKCDRCDQPGIRLVGESNEIIACIYHARAYDRGAEHLADVPPEMRERYGLADAGADVAAVESLAREWHARSDHAADGDPFGGYLCNCERVAERLAPLIAERVEAAKAEADVRWMKVAVMRDGDAIRAAQAEAWDVAHAELCDYALAERGVTTPLHRQNPYRTGVLLSNIDTNGESNA